MVFEASFELNIPHLECDFALQNNSFEASFELNIPHLECNFQLG